MHEGKREELCDVGGGKVMQVLFSEFDGMNWWHVHVVGAKRVLQIWLQFFNGEFQVMSNSGYVDARGGTCVTIGGQEL